MNKDIKDDSNNNVSNKAVKEKTTNRKLALPKLNGKYKVLDRYEEWPWLLQPFILLHYYLHYILHYYLHYITSLNIHQSKLNNINFVVIFEIARRYVEIIMASPNSTHQNKHLLHFLQPRPVPPSLITANTSHHQELMTTSISGTSTTQNAI